MTSSIERKVEDFRKTLEIYGEKTFYNLFSALLIWLFAILVFIPLAGSINRETEVLCNLIFFTVFTFLIARSLPGLKRIVDFLSILLAKKYGLKGGLNTRESAVVFKSFSYITLIIVFYLLYFPFLIKFHPSINGAALILALLSISLLMISIFPILLPRILEKLSSGE